MTRWTFSRNQIKDYAVIDNEVYNLDKKVYRHQSKVKSILSVIWIITFLVLIIILYKTNIDTHYISLIGICTAILAMFIQYIISTIQ